MAHVNTLQVGRGEYKQFDFTLKNSSTGAVLNLTSALARFTMRKSIPDAAIVADTDAVFTLTVGSGITLTDPTNGVMRVTLSGSHTSTLASWPQRYYYGLEVKLNGESDPRAVSSGFVFVTPDFPRAAPA